MSPVPPMTIVLRRWRWAFLSLLPVAALAQQPSSPALPTGEVAASWQAHEVDFLYMGFTTRYSCDGLRDKMKRLLKHVGARPDLKVRVGGCIEGYGRVSDFPRLKLVFHTAQPLSASGSTPPGGLVAARWETVELSRNRPRDLDVGDCELIEQFRDTVLPKFSMRIIDNQVSCIPHQLSGSRVVLKMQVLKALPTPDAAALPPPQ